MGNGGAQRGRRGAPHRVHPSLVLRLDEAGPVVVPLDSRIDARQEHDRLTYQQVTRVIPAGGGRLDLVAALVPGTVVHPQELVGAVPDCQHDDVSAFCRALVPGGLLEPTDGPGVRPPVRRLSGYEERPSDGSAAAADVVLADDQLVRLRLPLALVPDGTGFVLHGHDGRVRCALGVDDVRLLEALLPSGSIDTAVARLDDRGGAGGRPGEDVRAALRAALRAVLHRLAALGLVEQLDASIHLINQAIGDRAASRARSAPLFDAAFEARRPRWEARDDAIVVVPVDVDLEPPLALGTITTYAAAHLPPDVADRVVVLPSWSTAAGDVPAALARFPDRPLVFLYSLYIWNHRANLEVAEAVRALRPGAVNVAGGPDLPKYEGDSERYLRAHPEIDVAVRGEGEVTLCDLLTTLARAPQVDAASLPAALEGVAGISFLRDGAVVRTPDRERLADLDEIPSPYLTGALDHVEPVRLWYPLLESNRGCPYGCTFCDWGSATLSRIRKFDLGRVKAEIDWVVDHGAIGIGLADANFGMLDRDVEIAEHLVAVRERTGRPKAFGVNMAKNRVGNALEIVSLLAGAGILTEGLISTQSYDPVVLRTIRRANIRPAVFDQLAADFRGRDLPLSTDLMLGLPGSTPETFQADLQRAIDAEVHVRTHPTQLLVNSPMNAPEYRSEHGITAQPGDLVTSTTTFTEREWRQMMRTRQLFYFAERRGMLRQLATYVRAETGTPEMECYEHLRVLAETSPDHPHLAYALSVAAVSYLPPGDWTPLLEEVGAVMVDDLGVPDDDALRSVLWAQLALFLTGGRAFPATVELAHDVVAWHREVVAAKLAHPDGSWPAWVAPLRSFPPGALVVDDRRGRTTSLLGKSTIAAFDNNSDWELDSPLARPVPAAL